MQAGKTKADRKLSAATRAAARPAARKARRDVATVGVIAKKVRALNYEDRKRAAARHATIKEVKVAYAQQCAAHETEKAEARAERNRATIPAEAETNETR